VLALGVAVKVKSEPPDSAVAGMEAAFVDDTAKSETIAVDAPAASLTAIVQLMGEPARRVVTDAHDKLDAAVGLP
jgi:hypothetical protein